jgi:hypothetical protein
MQRENVAVTKLKAYWHNILETYRASKKELVAKNSFLTFDIYGRDNLSQNVWSVSIQNLKGSNSFPTTLHTKGQPFFSGHQEKFPFYNFLVIAKLLDLLGKTHSIRVQVCQLIKVQLKHSEIEKIFQIELLKNNFFLSWISYLLLEQIFKPLTIDCSSLKSFRLTGLLVFRSKKKLQIEIKTTKDSILMKSYDLSILNWYQKRFKAWSYQLLDNHTKAPSYQKIDLKSVNLDQNRVIRTKGLKQRYLKFIKQVLLRGKRSTQYKLIQRLNQLIKNWDASFINNLEKREAQDLNVLVSRFLWQWGFARHTKKSARWIQNRYWSLYPSLQS